MNKNRDGSERNNNAFNEPVKAGYGAPVELKSQMKLISFACYLIAFTLCIILSSIYFGIRISSALTLFEDIYSNWDNHFVVDIIELPTGYSSCSQIPALPEATAYADLVQYTFKGSRKGCFCEDCQQDDSNDDNEVSISSLLRQYMIDNSSDYYDDDDDDSSDYSRRRLARISRLTKKKKAATATTTQTTAATASTKRKTTQTHKNTPQTSQVNMRKRRTNQREQKRQQQRNRRRILSDPTDYLDQDTDELSSISGWKIMLESCNDVDSLNRNKDYQDIDQVSSQYINEMLLDSVDEPMHLCYARSASSNFITSYLKKANIGCPSGKKMCQAGSEQGVWFCVGTNENCPIRAVRVVTNAEAYDEIYKDYLEYIPLSNGEYTLLISRTMEIMPISEFGVYEEEGPCILPARKWHLQKENKILNPLINQIQLYLCSVDTRYLQTGIYSTQKDLYDKVGLLDTMNSAQYPTFFMPQSSVSLHLYTRQNIQFQLLCRDQLNDVLKLNELINKLNYLTVTIVSSSSGLSFLLFFDIAYIIRAVFRGWHSKPTSYPWKPEGIPHIIYSIFKYIAAFNTCMFDFMLFYRMINLRELQQDIIYQDCTDDISESQLSEMRNNLSFYGIFIHVIVMISYWASDIHLINFARKYCIMNKKKMAPFDEFFSLSKLTNENDIHGEEVPMILPNGQTTKQQQAAAAAGAAAVTGTALVGDRQSDSLSSSDVLNKPEDPQIPVPCASVLNEANKLNGSMNGQVILNQPQVTQPFGSAAQLSQNRDEINRIYEFNMELELLQQQGEEGFHPRIHITAPGSTPVSQKYMKQ